jgi:hypothetical protein
MSPLSISKIIFFAFGVKKIELKYFHHFQMIEYCRLNIDYLRSALADHF